MNVLMPNTTTATELQRNYKRVIGRAKKLKTPITVLSNNRAEAVVMDYELFSIWQKGHVEDKNTDSFKDLSGKWSKEEADEFDKTIDEMFEQIDLNEWK